MKVSTGRVVGGKVVLEGEPLIGTMSASGIIGTFLGIKSPGTGMVFQPVGSVVSFQNSFGAGIWKCQVPSSDTSAFATPSSFPRGEAFAAKAKTES